MEDSEILGSILMLDDSEREYKEEYLKNPERTEKLLSEWEEFSKAYYETPNEEKRRRMPLPSGRRLEFAEEDYFKDSNLQIGVVKHARYDGPFWHKTEFIKLAYVLRGEILLFADNQKRVFRRGDFYILSPNVYNGTYAGHDGDGIVNVLIKRSTFMSTFSSLLSEQGIVADFFWQMLYSRKSHYGIYYKGGENPEMEHLILQIYRECMFEERPSNLLLKSLIMAFFAHALRAGHTQTKEGEDPYSGQECFGVIGGEKLRDNRMYEIMSYTMEHLADMSLEHLAEHFRMSQGYLSRYIRHETGYTYSFLLRELRLKRAEEMLKSSRCSIEDILEAVGYTDISSFYRNFKNVYGLTPAKYRKYHEKFSL